jgi:hypothetical protein
VTKGLHPTFVITNRATAGFTQIKRAPRFLEAATLSESWVREMRLRAPRAQRLAVGEMFPFERKGGSR